jgi:hypothetical protein
VNVIGAGVCLDDGAAAVDSCCDAVAVEVALHAEGLLDADTAGAGADVDGDGFADVEVDAAGSGAALPVGGGLAVDFNVSRAGASVKATCDSIETNASGAGLGTDVAGGGLLKLDVTGAGLQIGRTLNAASPHGEFTQRLKPLMMLRNLWRDQRPALSKTTTRAAALQLQQGLYCWRMTGSPWLRPVRTSVWVPLEMPALMETLRRPFFCLASGTSTEALRSLS